MKEALMDLLRRLAAAGKPFYTREDIPATGSAVFFWSRDEPFLPKPERLFGERIILCSQDGWFALQVNLLANGEAVVFHRNLSPAKIEHLRWEQAISLLEPWVPPLEGPAQPS